MFGSNHHKEEILTRDFVRVREEEEVIHPGVEAVVVEHAMAKEAEAVIVTQVVRAGAEAARAVEVITAAVVESAGKN